MSCSKSPPPPPTKKHITAVIQWKKKTVNTVTVFLCVHVYVRAHACTRCMCKEAGRHADWQSEEDFLSVAQWEANPPPVSPSLRLSACRLSLSVSDKSHLFRLGALSAGLSRENQQALHSLLSSAKRQVGDWVFSGRLFFALFWIALARFPKNEQNWPIKQLWLRVCVLHCFELSAAGCFLKAFWRISNPNSVQLFHYAFFFFYMIWKGK